MASAPSISATSADSVPAQNTSVDCKPSNSAERITWTGMPTLPVVMGSSLVARACRESAFSVIILRYLLNLPR